MAIMILSRPIESSASMVDHADAAPSSEHVCRQMRSSYRHTFWLSLVRMSIGQFPSMANFIRTVLRYFCTTRWSTDHRERKLAADRARKTSGLVLNESSVCSQKTVKFMPCTLFEV